MAYERLLNPVFFWAWAVHKMMYGFGDDECPLPETVEVMDDIVCDFIVNMVSLISCFFGGSICLLHFCDVLCLTQ